MEYGVQPEQFICINFENMRCSHLLTAEALHNEIIEKPTVLPAKYTFSFTEFMELYHTVFPKTSTEQCFQKYLLCGGIPYLCNLRYEADPSVQYLTDLFNSVQLKDIVKRNKVRDVDLLERIIAYIMANIGTTFSANSLVKFFKNDKRTVAAETILNYIKYYISDHGIKEAVLGDNMRDIDLVLENIVYMELLL